jgi:Ca2+-binding RTX toxin-like protein
MFTKWITLTNIIRTIATSVTVRLTMDMLLSDKTWLKDGDTIKEYEINRGNYREKVTQKVYNVQFHSVDNGGYQKAYVTYDIAESRMISSKQTQWKYIPKPDNIDPLILDLNGDGLQLTEATGSQYFDFNNNGVKTATAWTQGNDDAFLAFDFNNNRQIDNGSELFGIDYIKKDGTKATSGIDALSDLDSNNDGLINNLDEYFDKILVWKDLNHNAQTDDGELFSLQDLNITEFNLAKLADKQNINGSTTSGKIAFTQDNQTKYAYNVDLQAQAYLREFADKIDSEENLYIPEIAGSVAVRDLNEAIYLDENLKNAVLDLLNNQQNLPQFAQSITNILHLWANTANWQSSTEDFQYYTKINGAKVDINDIAKINEIFYASNYGEKFTYSKSVYLNGKYQTVEDYGYKSAHGFTVKSHEVEAYNDYRNQYQEMLKAYETIHDNLVQGLICESYLTPYFAKIDFSFENESYQFDYSYLKFFIQNNDIPLNDLFLLHKFGNLPELQADILLKIVDNINELKIEDLQNLLTFNTKGRENNYLLNINGDNNNDILLGNNENNKLYGKAGDDIFVGGKGDDLFEGNQGNDIYIFQKGDGQDTISMHCNMLESTDTIKLADINIDDITFEQQSSNLILHYSATNNITINNFFGYYADYRNINVDIANQNYAILDLINSKTLHLQNHNSYTTNLVNNFILEKATKIVANKNDNIIQSSTENDFMQGMQGNDTYIFGNHFGFDTVYDYYGNNTLVFANLKPSDIKLTFSDNSKHAKLIVDDFNQITIDSFKWDVSHYQFDLQFANETLQITDLDVYGTNNSDNVTLGEYKSSGKQIFTTVYYALDGDDIVTGSSGADQICGGKGSDYLKGGKGDDVYIFAKGDGSDKILDNQGLNVLQLLDIKQNEVDIIKDGKHLKISLSEVLTDNQTATDSILLENFYNNNDSKQFVLNFEDATVNLLETWNLYV